MKPSFLSATMALNHSGGFCPDLFWSREAVWDTPDPQFTLCFRRTALSGAPLAAAAALAPWWWLSASRRASHVPPRFRPTALWSAKAGMSALLAANLACRFAVDAAAAAEWSPSLAVGLALREVGLLVATAASTAEHWARLPASALPSIFWMVFLLCGLPDFKDQVVVAIFCASW